jgi:hypothetical protein
MVKAVFDEATQAGKTMSLVHHSTEMRAILLDHQASHQAMVRLFGAQLTFLRQLRRSTTSRSQRWLTDA